MYVGTARTSPTTPNTIPRSKSRKWSTGIGDLSGSTPTKRKHTKRFSLAGGDYDDMDSVCIDHWKALIDYSFQLD